VLPSKFAPTPSKPSRPNWSQISRMERCRSAQAQTLVQLSS
jgi:hypothetical protein